MKDKEVFYRILQHIHLHVADSVWNENLVTQKREGNAIQFRVQMESFLK